MMIEPQTILARASTLRPTMENEIMPTAEASALGRRRKPVSSEVKPITLWANTGTAKLAPYRPMPTIIDMMQPAHSERYLRTRRSTMGWSEVRVRWRKSTMPTTERTAKVQMKDDDHQSSVWPSSSTVCKPPRPQAR